MIKLSERLTDLLCRARKIEALLIQVEKEMDGITSRDIELADLIQTLTPKELEILTLMTQGKKYSQIAGILGVSQNTLDAHRWNIRQRLKLTTSKDITRIVIPFMQKQK